MELFESANNVCFIDLGKIHTVLTRSWGCFSESFVDVSSKKGLCCVNRCKLGVICNKDMTRYGDIFGI